MTGQPLPDQDARTRAIHDHDTTFLVEAAAGTGKTTILVSRILALAESERAALPEIAAITFTEKAAGELKQRLRMALEERLRAAESPGDRDRYAAALRDLERMSVSTIHGFCGDLLRERPVEAGVSPEFAILDPEGRRELLDEVWEEWLEREASRENPLLREVLWRGIRLDRNKKSTTLRTLAESLVDQWHSFRVGGEPADAPPPEQVLAEAVEALALPEALAGLREALGGLTARSAFCKEAADTLQIHLGLFSDWLEQEPDAPAPPSTISDWLASLPSTKVSNKGRKDNWDLDLSGFREEIRHFGERVEELRARIDDAVLQALLVWLESFPRRFQAVKAARGVLDFPDLLLATRDMLRESRPARAWFKARIRRLLIDEFQDTDPLQTEIAFFLAEAADAHEREWTSVRLAPGRLFLVGDPKQSIYRFRGADLDLYGRVRSLVEAQGEVLRISVNFRSVPAVVSETNRMFAPLMQGPVDGRYEPEYVPLEPFRPSLGGGPAVHCLVPPREAILQEGESEEPERIALIRRREAAVLARWIRSAVESGLPVRDRESNATRGLRYRDVGILLRTMTAIVCLEEALTAEGIPFQVAAGKHYYAREEITDLLLVLRAIDIPYAPKWVVGALRTPFFGCSDEDLARHASEGGVFVAEEGLSTDVQSVREALALLRDLHAARSRLAPARVIERLFSATQAPALYRACPHGAQRTANLLRVRTLARERTGGRSGTFRGFVEWLSGRVTATGDEGEAPASEPGDDVVQCLTMHKAKGLEFPLVVLAQLGSKTSSSAPALLRGARSHPECSLTKAFTTLGFADAYSLDTERDEHEKRRLLYVAITRARDHLLLPLYWSNSETKGFNSLFRASHPPPDDGEPAGLPAGVESVRAVLPPGEPDAPLLRDPEFEEAHPDAPVEPARDSRRSWAAAHARAVALLDAGHPLRTASEALREAALEAAPAPDEPRREALSAHEPPAHDAAALVEAARRLGTLVHALLEQVDLPEGRMLEALSGGLAAEFGADEAERAEAVALVRTALETPLLRRAATADACAREAPFAAAAEGVLLEGIVDLVFLEPGGAVIVDYKTNRVTAAEARAAAERYRPQAAVYARALSEALPVPVREVVFLFLRPGVAESIPVDEALLSEAAGAEGGVP